MITNSGVHIQKIGGVEGTPTAMDIAVHAGRICRFGGAVWSPLLAHLVFVGLLAYKRSGSVANLLWGFLHDAHEAVTNDVPRPFKCDCMRREQLAIDYRLLERYFGDWSLKNLDFELIKQCDIDACHIEATMLALPGFAETELKYGKDYTNAVKIHDDINDQILFQRIFGSCFHNDTTDGEESLGVRLFGAALLEAEGGHYEGFLNAVKNWNLIDFQSINNKEKSTNA